MVHNAGKFDIFLPVLDNACVIFIILILVTSLNIKIQPDLLP